jgi:hypothetical protein
LLACCTLATEGVDVEVLEPCFELVVGANVAGVDVIGSGSSSFTRVGRGDEGGLAIEADEVEVEVEVEVGEWCSKLRGW